MVFGVKTVNKYNVDAFLFQLVAFKILTFEKNKKSEVSCVLVRNNTGGYQYRPVKT